MIVRLLLNLPLLAGIAAASVQIVPGATWTAKGTDQHIQAHGGGITQEGDTFYFIGENKLDGTSFQSVNCYSSTDLVSWTFVNELLSVGDSGDLGPNRVLERPHVLFNPATKKYVLWMHIDSSDYGEAKAGVAVGDSICGKYTYLESIQPLGHESRDMGLFQDTDGSGYLLTEDRANGLRINKLSEDYLTVESNVFTWAEKFESPAIYKDGETYFMFSSQLTGWDPNDNMYSTATSLSGPWSAWERFTPEGSKTFGSQTTSVISINGVIMYMGDRWDKNNLMRSSYVWLPLTLSGTTASLQNQVNWVLDIGAGTWQPGPLETTAEAESSSNVRENGAVLTTCSECSGGQSVGFIGGTPNGLLTFPNISSESGGLTSVRVHFTNADSTQRFANVIVNGVTHVTAFCPSNGDNTPAVSVLTVPLEAGDANTIQFSAFESGWAPNLDRLMVPVS